MRDLHIRGALRVIDHFIAPSHFLRERFIAWGLPPEKVTVIRNGLPAFRAAPERLKHLYRNAHGGVTIK